MYCSILLYRTIEPVRPPYFSSCIEGGLFCYLISFGTAERIESPYFEVFVTQGKDLSVLDLDRRSRVGHLNRGVYGSLEFVNFILELLRDLRDVERIY